MSRDFGGGRSLSFAKTTSAFSWVLHFFWTFSVIYQQPFQQIELINILLSLLCVTSPLLQCLTTRVWHWPPTFRNWGINWNKFRYLPILSSYSTEYGLFDTKMLYHSSWVASSLTDLDDICLLKHVENNLSMSDILPQLKNGLNWNEEWCWKWFLHVFFSSFFYYGSEHSL